MSLFQPKKEMQIVFKKTPSRAAAMLVGSLSLTAFSLAVQAEPQVSTVLSNAQSYDGIYVTKTGRVIVSHPGSDRLFEVVDGNAQLLSDGNGQFSYVVDINEDEAGNLLLTEFDRNLLLSMDSEGTITQIASVPGGNDIVLDSNAAMYVADSKTNNVHQVLADGTVNTIIGLSDPVGLAMDDADNLYASVSSGEIYYIDVNAQTATEIATIASQIWHLEIMGSETLLVAGYSSHEVYAVDISTGSTCVVAGGSAGQTDGAGRLASFTNPLDLSYDGGQSVYVTSAGSVRRIDFPQDSSVCAEDIVAPPPPPPPPPPPVTNSSGGSFGMLLVLLGVLVFRKFDK